MNNACLEARSEEHISMHQGMGPSRQEIERVEGNYYKHHVVTLVAVAHRGIYGPTQHDNGKGRQGRKGEKSDSIRTQQRKHQPPLQLTEAVTKDKGEGENTCAILPHPRDCCIPSPAPNPSLHPLVPEVCIRRTKGDVKSATFGFHLFLSLVDGSRSRRLRDT